MSVSVQARRQLLAPVTLIGLLAVVVACWWIAAPPPDARLMRIATLLLLAPLIEEALFRAGVQETLIHAGQTPRVCIVITALLFALAHLLASPGWLAAGTVLPGLVLGLVYQRTRSVAHCALLHAAMNAVWLGVAAA